MTGATVSVANGAPTGPKNRYAPAPPVLKPSPVTVTAAPAGSSPVVGVAESVAPNVSVKLPNVFGLRSGPAPTG